MLRKRLPIFLIGMLLGLSVLSCGKSKKTTDNSVPMEKSLIEVSIGGMTCTGCEETIQARVGMLEGINSVKASYVTGKALVEYLPGITDTVKIRAAITGSGYTVSNFKPVAENTIAE